MFRWRQVGQEEFRIWFHKPDFSNEVEQGDPLFDSAAGSMGSNDDTARKPDKAGLNLDAHFRRFGLKFRNDVSKSATRVPQPNLKPVRFVVRRRLRRVCPQLRKCGAANVFNRINERRVFRCGAVTIVFFEVFGDAFNECRQLAIRNVQDRNVRVCMSENSEQLDTGAFPFDCSIVE
ncbi:hypothetical protein DO71_5253 [Burkholderia pseudomallei]|nr:hypothetical protein DO71_5253 [Burkholderia pseudomallei]KGD40242.1 hypothetical protein DO72_4489 [Burkholderia pseudomallei]